MLFLCTLLTALAQVSLASLEPTSLELPPGDSVADITEIPVVGPFRLVGVQSGVRSYEAPSPIRTRALFFFAAPDNMRLRRDDTTFSYSDEPVDQDRAGTWFATADAITVRIRANAPAPRPGDFTVAYPRALQREKSLHLQASGLDKNTFVRQSFQVHDRTRAGLYLPAPATITWELELPENATFATEVGILPPEVDDGRGSDGATVELWVDGEKVASHGAKLDQFSVWKVNLSRWAGKKVKLELRSQSDDPTRDHVQLAQPVIYSPKADPRKVILVFVDTLRRDHLAVYGYNRDAAPQLTTRARDAVIFEDARTVAPWTLPSSRAVLSGRQPEAWFSAKTLPERLSARGWATGAFVGNVYLSSNFDMTAGWGEHGCVNWPLAEVSSRRALDFLRRHRDQDSLVMVHYMDMHLPYKEPWSYQGLYAPPRPDYLPEGFLRPTLLGISGGKRAELKQYLKDRYDQNLHYIDDQLAPILKEAGPNAIVVFFADHGEEFFDHGDLEHGHTLYDELLRVPLMIWAPGLTGRRVDAPASLLDVTPTVLELLGYPTDGLDGFSLAALARGEGDPRFDHRARGFGRPLYGEESWGAERGGEKYYSRRGKEWYYDLKTDPDEKQNLRAERDPVPMRAAMTEGLGRQVVLAWRVTPNKKGGTTTVDLSVPAGIVTAWVGDDPLLKSEATVEQKDATTVRMRFDGTKGQQREIYVLPKGDPLEATNGALLQMTVQGAAGQPLDPKPADGSGEPLAKLRVDGRDVELTWAVVPVPAEAGVAGMDPELQSALEAMGYMSRE